MHNRKEETNKKNIQSYTKNNQPQAIETGQRTPAKVKQYKTHKDKKSTTHNS